MSDNGNPSRLQTLVDRLSNGDRSTALALHALICCADDSGAASFNDIAVGYRNDHLAAQRAAGRDAEREAGELSMDQVRAHLATSVLPRLASEDIIRLRADEPLEPDTRIRLNERLWTDVREARSQIANVLKQTGEHPTPRFTKAISPAAPATGTRVSVLEAKGLVKIYRRRRVVNDVALRLQQGEIVGLLGPNGAGKTTTFYMIVGLIQPLSGQILLDGADITAMPMYQRSRKGLGYLSQEPSIFRKLSVEDNIVAILETLPLSKDERAQRLESLLDEPFAGVDPIAVHDIQTIVAGLRHRGIGVLISDHNVEQTLDIVDRAYIMFDGQVKVSGTVRELVFDDTVADIYLGPTLTARLRARFATESQGDGA